MCVRHKNQYKERVNLYLVYGVFGINLGTGFGNLAFVQVFKPHTHKLCILRDCTYIVYTVEPVYSATPRDQGNVSDCTGCRNTQVLFYLTQLLWDHKFFVGKLRCRIAQVPLSIYIQWNLCNPTPEFPTSCDIRQRFIVLKYSCSLYKT